MDVRLLFPTQYLSAADLRKEDRTVTIRGVTVDELKTSQGSEKKPCVYFEETKAAADRDGKKEKRLVLNKTNAMTIASLYGYEVDEWKGKRITLYPTQADAFGKTVDCIRVRPTVPPAAAPAEPTETATETQETTDGD